MDGAVDKKTLRALIDQRIALLGAETQASESARLAQTMDGWLDGPGTGTEVILATLPLGPEPDLSPFLRRWLDRGRLALARTGPGRTLEFRYVNSLAGPWAPHPYGLREPPEDATLWTAGRPTLCLVPGVAFGQGHGGVARLGRGAGYYDRWLEVHRNEVTTLGVGFSVQWVASVPTEAHDQNLDGWAGPDGVAMAADQRARMPSQNTE